MAVWQCFVCEFPSLKPCKVQDVSLVIVLGMNNSPPLSDLLRCAKIAERISTARVMCIDVVGRNTLGSGAAVFEVVRDGFVSFCL